MAPLILASVHELLSQQRLAHPGKVRVDHLQIKRQGEGRAAGKTMDFGVW